MITEGEQWEKKEAFALRLIERAKETELKEYEEGRPIDSPPHLFLLRELELFLSNSLDGYFLPTTRERDARFIRDSILILFEHFSHKDNYSPGEDILIQKLRPLVAAMKSWEDDFSLSQSSSQVLLRTELESRLELYLKARNLLDKRRELLQEHFSLIVEVVFEDVDLLVDEQGKLLELDSPSIFAAARKRDELFEDFTAEGLQSYFFLTDSIAANELYRRKEEKLLQRRLKKNKSTDSIQDIRDELEVLALWKTLTEVEITP